LNLGKPKDVDCEDLSSCIAPALTEFAPAAAFERNEELGDLIRSCNLPAAIDRLIYALLESVDLRPV
jgi:hypothetical protein